jgi:hypothetical protein
MTAIPLAREDDTPVGGLAPGAFLVIDSSGCIVLATPERRITVTDVASWQQLLGTSRQMARAMSDEAEKLRTESLANFRRDRGISMQLLSRILGSGWTAMPTEKQHELADQFTSDYSTADTQLSLIAYGRAWCAERQLS